MRISFPVILCALHSRALHIWLHFLREVLLHQKEKKWKSVFEINNWGFFHKKRIYGVSWSQTLNLIITYWSAIVQPRVTNLIFSKLKNCYLDIWNVMLESNLLGLQNVMHRGLYFNCTRAKCLWLFKKVLHDNFECEYKECVTNIELHNI